MEEKKKEKGFNKYVQLTSLGFQMAGIMFFFIWLGKMADEKWGAEEKNYFVLLGTFAGLGISLYLVLRQLKQIDEK